MPRPRPSRAPESQRWCDDVPSLMYTQSRPIYYSPLPCTLVIAHMCTCSGACTVVHVRHGVCFFEQNTVRDMTQVDHGLHSVCGTRHLAHTRERDRHDTDTQMRKNGVSDALAEPETVLTQNTVPPSSQLLTHA